MRSKSSQAWTWLPAMAPRRTISMYIGVMAASCGSSQRYAAWGRRILARLRLRPAGKAGVGLVDWWIGGLVEDNAGAAWALAAARLTPAFACFRHSGMCWVIL